MAKVSNETKVYELQSRDSKEIVFVTERAQFKLQKIDGHVVRSPLLTRIVDRAGRSFERIDGMRMRCIVSGELFQIVDQAPSIRKESA